MVTVVFRPLKPVMAVTRPGLRPLVLGVTRLGMHMMSYTLIISSFILVDHYDVKICNGLYLFPTNQAQHDLIDFQMIFKIA